MDNFNCDMECNKKYIERLEAENKRLWGFIKELLRIIELGKELEDWLHRSKS